MHRSPLASVNLVENHSKEHCISLVHEPPSRKGQIYSFPHPLEVLGEPHSNLVDGPRAAIIFNPSLNIWHMPQYSNRDCQVALWQIHDQKIALISAYWPINCNDLINHLETVVASLSHDRYKILIGIDSNAHHIKWGSPKNDRRGCKLLELMQRHKLLLLNEGTEPTFIGGQGKSHIDLTIISENLNSMAAQWAISQTDSHSDHKCLITTISKREIFKRKIPDFSRANWDLFGVLIKQIDWSGIHLNSKCEVEAAVMSLTATVQEIVGQVTPSITIRTRPKRPQWWNDDIELNRRAVRVQYHATKQMDTIENQERYKELRNKLRQSIKKAKFNLWKEHASSSINVSAASKLARCIIRKRAGPIGLTKKSNGEMTTNGLESLCNLIDTHFPDLVTAQQEVWASADHPHINDTNQSPPGEYFTPEPGLPTSDEDIEWITTGNTSRFIALLPVSKSPGPDGINNRVLKNLPGEVLEHITKIFKKCIAYEFIPKGWLVSNVIFIPKGGAVDKTNPKSYRPICLANTLFKILEKHIQYFLEIQKIYPNKLTQHQHGFRHDHSTMTALSTVVNYVELAHEVGETVVAVLLDIEGAFDNVKTFKSLSKLGDWGTEPKILNTLSYYYAHRIVTGQVKGEKVEKHPQKGTAQGNVLSPMLWNVAVDAIGSIIDRHNIGGCLFADDVTLLCRGIDIGQVANKMQRVLTDVEEWATDQALNVNLKKSVSICFKKPHLQRQNYYLFWRGTRIPQQAQTKYLGLVLTETLDWKPHFEEKFSKAKSQMVQINKSLGKAWGPSPKLTHWMYTSIIRPKITYGCHIWCHKLPKQWLEAKSRQVQRWALTKLGPVREKTPTAGLEIISNTPPLELIMGYFSMKTIIRFLNVNFRPLQANFGHLRFWQNKLQTEVPLALQMSDRELRTSAPVFHSRLVLPKQVTNQADIYTDGSGIGNISKVIESGNSQVETDTNESEKAPSFGSGFYLEWPNENGKPHSRVGIYPNGRYYSVFLSEIKAITKAVYHFINESVRVEQVVIFTDCLSALKALNSSYTNSATVRECWQWLKVLDASYEWSIQWIKSHAGNVGNENADKLAKAAAKLSLEGANPWTRVPPKQIDRLLSNHLIQSWTTYWQNRPDCRQTKLWLPTPDPKKSKQILALNRDDFGLITRWITGHCYLARHQAFMHPEIDKKCYLCQEAEETPWHLLNDCPAVISKNLIPPEPWSVAQLLQAIHRIRFLEVLDYPGPH